MKERRGVVTRLLILLAVVFLLVSAAGLYMGSRYISGKLLKSGQAMAIDIALLVKNNFSITDEEVAYMKSLTFNEMEVDPINRRLMDVGNGVALNAAVSNVYLLCPLRENEYRYCPDEKSADFLGFTTDTPLDGVWLLNGRINEDGVFEVAQRDDIFRYTALDENQLRGMEEKIEFGTFTTDAWGSFITGYAPIYTVEGSFVGLLGIDMDPDPYQSSAEHMSLLIIALFAVIMILFFALSIVFFLKYAKIRELERQFAFFSDMSHEMRTPLNGILGMAVISRQETDSAVLRQNFAKVESSGDYLLKLINRALNFRNETEQSAGHSALKASASPRVEYPELSGRRILLCEDHPVNAEITRRMAEMAGCSTDLAENGQLGLELFERSPNGYYDAVLMDIRMPVMDGNEAARSIRALNRDDAGRVPIIAVTANYYAEDIQRTRKAGMNAHLTKPLKPSDLYKTLSAVFYPQNPEE